MTSKRRCHPEGRRPEGPGPLAKSFPCQQRLRCVPFVSDPERSEGERTLNEVKGKGLEGSHQQHKTSRQTQVHHHSRLRTDSSRSSSQRMLRMTVSMVGCAKEQVFCGRQSMRAARAALTNHWVHIHFYTDATPKGCIINKMEENT